MGKFIDITGQKFGRLTVIKRVENDKYGQAMWFCQCVCGNKITTRGSALRGRTTKSCGCIQSPNLIGQRFGRLVVMKKIKNNKYQQSMWLCKCDCGNYHKVAGKLLRNKHTKSCGCLKKEANALPNGESAFNCVLLDYKNHARQRNLSWELTKKQFRELTEQNCFYCGISPQQEKKSQSNTGSYIYNGVDRVDNSKGYTIDNVVPCCKICNRAKDTMTQKEFLGWKSRKPRWKSEKFYIVR